MTTFKYLKSKVHEISDIFGRLSIVVFSGVLVVLVFVIPVLIRLYGGIFIDNVRFVWVWGWTWIDICLELLGKIF